MNNLQFIDLGFKDYKETWKLQEEILEKGKENKAQGLDVENKILFVEHNNIYTLGKSGDISNLLTHAECLRVDRGGDITYHGPGQLVAYPILDLEAFNMGIKDYVYNLEKVVIETLKDYDIIGDRLKGATGVWLDKNSANARKICAIGIHCSRFITTHGFALNVNTDLSYFDKINPCGFKDKGVTSIKAELAKNEDVNMNDIKLSIQKNFNNIFK